MSDLRQALSEISAIRAQVARGTQFRGYGPASIAASGPAGFTGRRDGGAICESLPGFRNIPVDMGGDGRGGRGVDGG